MQSLRISRILVPVDGSECSRYAAEHALRIAQAYGAEVVFLHAVDTQVVEELAQSEPDDGRRARDRLYENGRIYLADAARLAAEHGVAHREQLDEGDPCAVIAAASEAVGVDLVVMGKMGRRGARRILMGSITRRVVESSERPVLIVSTPPGSFQHADPLPPASTGSP